MTILEVYKDINLRREATKKGLSQNNCEDKQKMEDEINTLGWVMSLLEKTKEINPTK